MASTTRERLAFAIPASTVRYVVGQILRYGHVRRPWIGVDVARAPEGRSGLMVVRVYPGSPAGRAGVRPGDFLTKIGERSVYSLRDVVHALERDRVGERVTLTFARGAVTYQVHIRLGERPHLAAAV